MPHLCSQSLLVPLRFLAGLELLLPHLQSSCRGLHTTEILRHLLLLPTSLVCCGHLLLLAEGVLLLLYSRLLPGT